MRGSLEPPGLHEHARMAFLVRWGVPALEGTMIQVDQWEKAADCERALRLTLDPVHRDKLKDIREFWISLANAKPFLSEQQFAKEAESIGRLHAKT